MKKKAKKWEPILISSREGMRSVASDLVRDKLALKELQVQIEQEKAETDRKYKDQVDDLGRSIQMAEGGLQVWASQHSEEFADKRSIDLGFARLGFRKGPPKVEKRGKFTWPQIVTFLLALVVREKDAAGNETDTVVFEGADYVRYGEPTVNKDAILNDRETIPEEALKLAGIFIDQDEFFYFEPTSEVIDATVQKAA